MYKDLKTQMNNTDFKADRVNTFFIVHGYLASGNSSWMTTMKNRILGEVETLCYISLK